MPGIPKMRIPPPLKHRGPFTVAVADVVVDAATLKALPPVDNRVVQNELAKLDAGLWPDPIRIRAKLKGCCTQFLLEGGLETWTAAVIRGRRFLRATIEP